jgi:hypothetical protein
MHQSSSERQRLTGGFTLEEYALQLGDVDLDEPVMMFFRRPAASTSR